MKNKKNLISTIIVSVISLLFIVILFFQNQQLEEKKNEITTLNNTITELQTPKKQACTFIQTWRVLEILDYQGEVEEAAFILVDQFQMHVPVVLQVTQEQIQNLKVNTIYEFTFSGEFSNPMDVSQFKVVAIEETSKRGMEQTQELCEYNIVK